MPRKTRTLWKRPRLDVPVDDVEELPCLQCKSWMMKVERSTGRLVDRHPGVTGVVHGDGSPTWDVDVTCRCANEFWVYRLSDGTLEWTDRGRARALERREALAYDRAWQEAQDAGREPPPNPRQAQIDAWVATRRRSPSQSDKAL